MEQRPLKRRRRRDNADEEATTEDRISSLPDDILLSIISLLPVANWPVAAVVSKRWRRFASLLPRLDFFLYTPAPHLASPPPLPRALLRRLNVVVDCILSNANHRYIIKQARDACVEELVIETPTMSDYSAISIPDITNKVKSLRLLTVKNYECYLGSHRFRPVSSMPMAFGWTLLRTLELVESFINQHTLDAILRCCLRLETLHLINCSNFTVVNIRSYTLKDLCINSPMRLMSIDVHAPNLQALTLNLRQIKLYYLRIQAPKIQKVDLHLFRRLHPLRGNLSSFLLAAKKLTSLTLNAAATKFLTMECEKLKSFDIWFEKMRNLTISLDIKEQAEALFLIKLLEKCPHLAQLTIEAAGRGRSIVTSKFARHSERLKQLACLPCDLQEVNLLLLMRAPYEEELLRLLFTEAKALKRFKLQLPKHSTEKVVSEILSLKVARDTKSWAGPDDCDSIRMDF